MRPVALLRPDTFMRDAHPSWQLGPAGTHPKIVAMSSGPRLPIAAMSQAAIHPACKRTGLELCLKGVRAFVGSLTFATASAADTPSTAFDLPLGLQSYEPSAFGYTKFNNDVSYENVQLSVKFH
jgi:hypothetical protein